MSASPRSSRRSPPGASTIVPCLTLVVGALLHVPSVAAQADAPPPVTVQPGPPGEPSRTLDSADLARMEPPGYSEADVRFIQGMIRHHAQALEMVDLLDARTRDEDLRRLGLRIRISQEDEIDLMERWLRERGEAVPAIATGAEGRRSDKGGDGGGTGAGANDRGTVERGTDGDEVPSEPLPGMLTPDQMESLEGAPDATFVLRFLELMIEHHEGALQMVDRLFGRPGAGQVPSVYHVAAEVQADQSMEIERMREMLEEMDP